MHPELFRIPFIPLTVTSYGVMMVCGFIAAIYIIRRLSRGMGENAEHVTTAALYSLIAGIAGARIFYVVHYWQQFRGDNAAEQIRETMEALTKIGIQAVVTYPNADAGGRRMLQVINEYNGFPWMHSYRNISYSLYLGLMNMADVLVGNSSAGIIEAPSFGLPVVNIGTRQIGREKAENVIDVGYSRKEILEAIRKALSPEFKSIAKSSKNPYGDGKTGCRIARILEEIA